MKIKVNGIKKEYKIRNGLICPVISDIFSLKEKIREYRMDRIIDIRVASNTNDLNNPIFNVVIDFIDCMSLRAEVDLLELGALNYNADLNKRESWENKWSQLNSYIDRSLDESEMLLVLQQRWEQRNAYYSVFLVFIGAIISFVYYLVCHEQTENNILFYAPFTLSILVSIFLLRRKCPTCLSSYRAYVYSFETHIFEGENDRQ